ncbi:SIS domain-containing protein [Candidatus Poribacteria bacterium]|nr:SIS domain-containing protein [Candidatus Poribacteria bacterium]
MSAHVKRHMGIGSNVVDVIYRTNQIAGPDLKTYLLPDESGDVHVEVVGGVTLNHLAWARLLGVPTGLFGYQGNDHHGTVIRGTMDRHRIDRSSVRVVDGAATGFSVIYVDPDAERAIYMFRGPTGTTTPENIRADFADAIRDAAMVSTEVSQLPLPTVIEVLRIARDAGVRTFLDVDVSPDFCVNVAKLGSRDELEATIRLADVVKPAKSAAVQLSSEESAEKQAQSIHAKYGSKLVAITDGGRGSVFADGHETLRVQASEIKAVDTTGAGDAFFGGMIAGIHFGLDMEATARLANACGGACCQVVGAFPVLGTSRHHLMELYSAGWPHATEDDTPPKSRAAHVGVRTLRAEAEALAGIAGSFSMESLDEAAHHIMLADLGRKRVHITGVGKCRHVGHKIAATFASLGTPAYFLDPLDALHGDSGAVMPGDVVLAISNSGKTQETVATVQLLEQNGATVIAMTSSAESPLARLASVVLLVPVEREADPLGLAPTSSTTCQLAVGDALAVTVASLRGFTREDFGRHHPGGVLGERARAH